MYRGHCVPFFIRYSVMLTNKLFSVHRRLRASSKWDARYQNELCSLHLIDTKKKHQPKTNAMTLSALIPVSLHIYLLWNKNMQIKYRKKSAAASFACTCSFFFVSPNFSAPFFHITNEQLQQATANKSQFRPKQIDLQCTHIGKNEFANNLRNVNGVALSIDHPCLSFYL